MELLFLIRSESTGAGKLVFQILSLSGGGYLGLYTASVLAGLEARAGKPLHETFDLIAGTSIGGIIALGLSSGRSAEEIKQAFLTDGHRIFGSSPPPQNICRSITKLVSGLPRSRYGTKGLRSVIHRVVGEDTSLADLHRPTIATAVNLTKGGPKVFKTGHHPSLVQDWRLKATDVALATSAAPTYFPIHRIGNELFADGGLVANSPDLVAVHEAEQFLGVARQDIRLLSVGTTTASFSFTSAIRQELGSFGWMRRERLTNAMIGSQQAMTHDMMRHILKDQYIRIDRARNGEQLSQLALDCASESAKADLQALANQTLVEEASNTKLAEILAHKAPPFSFFNAS